MSGVASSMNQWIGYPLKENRCLLNMGDYFAIKINCLNGICSFALSEQEWAYILNKDNQLIISPSVVNSTATCSCEKDRICHFVIESDKAVHLSDSKHAGRSFDLLNWDM